jgi:hypothetical protein
MLSGSRAPHDVAPHQRVNEVRHKAIEPATSSPFALNAGSAVALCPGIRADYPYQHIQRGYEVVP